MARYLDPSKQPLWSLSLLLSFQPHPHNKQHQNDVEAGNGKGGPLLLTIACTERHWWGCPMKLLDSDNIAAMEDDRHQPAIVFQRDS